MGANPANLFFDINDFMKKIDPLGISGGDGGRKIYNDPASSVRFGVPGQPAIDKRLNSNDSTLTVPIDNNSYVTGAGGTSKTGGGYGK